MLEVCNTYLLHYDLQVFSNGELKSVLELVLSPTKSKFATLYRHLSRNWKSKIENCSKPRTRTCDDTTRCFFYTYILKLSRKRCYVFQKMTFKVFYSIVRKGFLNQLHTKKLFSNCNFVCELEYKLLTCLNIIHNDFQLIITLINFVPCLKFCIFFHFST